MGNRPIKKSQSTATRKSRRTEAAWQLGGTGTTQGRQRPGCPRLSPAPGCPPGEHCGPWATPAPPATSEQLPSNKRAKPDGLSQQFHLFTLSPQPSPRGAATPPPALPPPLGALRSPTQPAPLARDKHRGRPAAALPCSLLARRRPGGSTQRTAHSGQHSPPQPELFTRPRRRLRSFPGYFRVGAAARPRPERCPPACSGLARCWPAKSH